jgi:putative endonuclease
VVERPEASGASGVIKIMYFVYILNSIKTNKYYIGSCKNIEERIKQHNAGKSSYTKSGIPWKIVKIINCHNKTKALKLERFIKKQKSRVFIEKIINNEIILNYPPR